MSENVQKFPEPLRNFQKYSEFPEVLGNFWNHLGISISTQEFLEVLGNFPSVKHPQNIIQLSKIIWQHPLLSLMKWSMPGPSQSTTNTKLKQQHKVADHSPQQEKVKLSQSLKVISRHCGIKKHTLKIFQCNNCHIPECSINSSSRHSKFLPHCLG